MEQERFEKVNIIAHSMGGLDVRHMMFNDRNSGDIHKWVASLTTMSKPHVGSPFADCGTESPRHVIPMAQKLGLNIKAFDDLRTDRFKGFNVNADTIRFEENCEESILFQTYACKQDFWLVFDALNLSFYIIEKKEGDNDGLLSVKSAKWRDRNFKRVLENSDHLNELTWWDTAQMFSGESESALIERIHKF